MMQEGKATGHLIFLMSLKTGEAMI